MTGKRIKVEYYALFREQAGTGEEWVETEAETTAALYRELAERHRFSLGTDRLKVAVNAEFEPWDAPLADGDEVVFIPPVAGG